MSSMGEYGVRAWNGRQNSTAPQVPLISTLKGNNQIITLQCRDSIPELQDQESDLPTEMPLINLLISKRSKRNYPQKYSSSSNWTWNLFFKQSLLYLRPSFWSNLESLEMHEIRSDQCLFTSAAAWTKNISIKIFVNNFFFVFAMLSLPAVGVANMYYKTGTSPGLWGPRPYVMVVVNGPK